MRLVVDVGGQDVVVELGGDGMVRPVGGPAQVGGLDAGMDAEVDVRCVRRGLYSVVVGGRAYEVAVETESLAAGVNTPAHVARMPGLSGSLEPRVHTRDGERDVTVTDARTRALQALRVQRSGTAGGSAVVAAPMPGKVVAVRVRRGDLLDRGDAVVVLEAMKMESVLAAPQSGTVAEVLVSAGETVQQRQPLVRIEA